MASYVKFELQDGTVVYVESTEAPRGSSGLIPGGKAGDHAAQESVSFDKAVESVRKLADTMLKNLRQESEEQPEELQITFGLKASAEVGGLAVSRGGMESNFNVMLRWRSPDKEEKEENAEEEKPSKK